MPSRRLQGVFFVVVGIGLLIGAAVAGARTARFVASAETVEGAVTRLFAGGSHPVIEFTTASGQKVSYTQGGGIFGYKAGDRVRVLYPPDAPAKDPCVDAFGALWFVPMLLGVLGLFFVAGGIVQLVWAGRLI